MSFRPRFDCLWCGTTHVTRTPQDLEGWASLCPTCIGRAGDNGFLRARLRTALAERSQAAGGGVAAAAERGPGAEDRADPDGFYRRAGRFSAGVIADAAWLMELDAVTTWVDGLCLGPVVVELGAGPGWWSALLASKAELWAYDPSDAALDRLRQRLVAHGLRAHLHRRDHDAPAERAVDTVFAAFVLGSAADEPGLDARLAAIAAWLLPGGSFVFVEARAGMDGGGWAEGPDGPARSFDEASLRERLARHGLTLGSLAPGGRALIAGTAERVDADADHPGERPDAVRAGAQVVSPAR